MKLSRYGYIIPAIVIPFLGFAQETDSNTTDEVIDLSPFVVDGSQDSGYYASQTLAGTRIRTNVRDLATSISIVTEDYLDDTNSTDLGDVLVFQANTEISGMMGNFSGSQGATPGDPIGELARDNNSGGVSRVRGLAEADLTREYFLTAIPLDTYNSTRVEIQRGSNAALFGLGSPAGIINNTLLKAQMEGNFGRVRLKVDEYGAFRSELRYNNEVIEDTLAIAVAGLFERERFEQKEAFNDQERIYLTGTWRPFDDKTFTVRVSGEYGDRDAAMPRMMPPGDLMSHWYGLRDVGGFQLLNSPLEVGQYWAGNDDVHTGLGINNNLWVQTPGGAQGPTVFWLDPNSGDPDPLGAVSFQWRNEIAAPTPFDNTHRGMYSLRTYNDSLARTGVYPESGKPIPVAGSGSLWDTRTGRQVLDRSIFDYRKHLLDGGLSKQFAEFDDIIVEVEKLFFDNRLGVNYAYHHENFKEGQLNQLRGDPGGESIMIDLNPFLGTTEPTLGAPLRPNPNYGQIAIMSRAENGISRNERNSHRLSIFADVRASDVFEEDSWVERILGHVDLSGVYQSREQKGTQLYTRDTTSPDDLYANLLGDDPKANFFSRSFYMNQYHALDFNGRGSGVLPINFSSAADLAGLKIQPINGKQSMPDSHTFSMLNLTTQSYEDVVLGIFQATDNGGFPATFSGSKRTTEIDSLVINGTWHLLDDLVVFQYAWREDDTNTQGVSAPSITLPNGNPGRDNLFDPDYVAGPVLDPANELSQQNRSWGVVVHTPDFIKKYLPGGMDFSFHYGEADNFQPGANGVYVDGSSIPGESGSTKEWGFTVSAMDNRFLARVNFFETGIINDGFFTSAVSAPEGILVDLARQLDNPDNVAQGFTASDAQAVLPSQAAIDLQGVDFDWVVPDNTQSNPNPARDSTKDFVSEGVEIELIWNPTPRWTMLLKVGEQETVTQNTSPVLRDWYDEFVEPNWIDSSFAQKYFINDDSSQTLSQRAGTSIRDLLLQAEALDGTPTTEQRKWRYVLTTKYRLDDIFTDWGVRGMDIGGTLRYEDKLGIGHPAKVDEFGRVVPDINNPFYGPSMTFLDLFLSVDTELMGMDTTFQLYISDVTNHDGLIPVHGNPDGTATYRILEGRVISLSATVKF